jgi:hypothetical protein
MKQDYDETTLKGFFREVMEEFFPDKSTPATGWDVSNEDRETDDIVPTYTPGDDPVSVRIVADAPTIVVQRGSLVWGGQTTVVGATPQLIVGKDARRRTVIVKNISSNPVALAPEASIKFVAAGGFGPALLPAGDAVTLDTRGDIWSVAASTSLGEAIVIYQVFDDGQ